MRICCNNAEGVAARKVSILEGSCPFGGILGRADQINLVIGQHLQGVIPAVAFDEFDVPIGILTQAVKIFNIHTGVAAVCFFLMIPAHREKSDLYRSMSLCINRAEGEANKQACDQQKA